MMIQFKRQNSKSTALKAGIAGAVIGAAGTAIGIAMTDEKNRKLVMSKVDDAKSWTDKKVKEMKPVAENKAKEIKAATNGEAPKARTTTK